MNISFKKAAKYHLVTRWEYNPWSMPAHDFEKSTCLKGIAGNWQFPRYASASVRGLRLNEKYYRFLGCLSLVDYTTNNFLGLAFNMCSGRISSENCAQDMRKELKVLTALNPILESLDSNSLSERSVYHVLMGVYSGFNFDDIQHFITRTKAQALADYEDNERLCTEIGKRLYWSPAPKTRQKIRDALINVAPEPAGH